MPLILTNTFHIQVSLGLTYRVTWDASPEELRRDVELGVMPGPDAD